MTHDPVRKSTLNLGELFRLWIREPNVPSHWTMAGCGYLDDIERMHGDIGIHFPDNERLILPANERPCGRPAPCDLCFRKATYHGKAVETGKTILLCGRCLQRASKG